MKLFVDGPALLEYFVAEEEDSIVASSDPDLSRANLRRWLGRYCEARDATCVLVWDDCEPNQVRPPTQQFGRVKVVNLPYGDDAYMEISGSANRAAQKEHAEAVTDDPRIMDALSRGKATPRMPDEFVRRARRSMRPQDEELADEPDEKFGGLSEDEVEFWVQYFDEEE